MILLFAAIFYALYLALWFCIVATVIVLMAAFYVLLFFIVLAVEVGTAIWHRRRPRKVPPPRRPHRPTPQAKWSNRR